MASTPKERLFALLQARAFIQANVVLSSGKQSDHYFDCRMVEVSADGAYCIGEALYEHLKDLEFDAIGGLAVGAVPLVTAFVMSCHLHRRSVEGFWVREEAKGHGTRKVVEGNLRQNARVVILDDVVTSGKSVLKAIEEVEAKGAQVVLILTLIDRQEGAAETFERQNYRYESLFTKEDFLAHAKPV